MLRLFYFIKKSVFMRSWIMHSWELLLSFGDSAALDMEGSFASA